MEQKILTPVIKGVVISLILIVISIIGYFTNIDFEGWFRWTNLGIFCLAIIWSCISFGKQSNDNVTFGSDFVHGFKTSGVVACIMVLYALLFMFIFPDMKERAIDIARKSMEEKQQMTDEQISTAIEFTKKTFTLFLVLGSIIGYLFFGVLASLLGAAITKKNPQDPFDKSFNQ